MFDHSQEIYVERLYPKQGGQLSRRVGAIQNVRTSIFAPKIFAPDVEGGPHIMQSMIRSAVSPLKLPVRARNVCTASESC